MSWPRYLAMRLAAMALVLLVASMIVYGSMYLTPGGPLSFLIGSRSATPQQIAAITQEYHLNDPLATRYFAWLSDLLRGNLGMSLIYRDQVSSLIAPRLATTALLVAYATVLIVVMGVGSGLLSAIRGRWTSGVVSAINVVWLATPAFVVGVLLIIVLAVQHGYFPVQGAGSGLVSRLWHLTLPAISVALASGAYLSRITHASARRELASEHVETAIGRGLPLARVIHRHVVRNAAMPIVTAATLTSASLIAASVVVENVFALPGLGSLLVQSILQDDYAVVQAVVLMIILVFTVINLAIDLTYSWMDPRVSLGGGR